jgi:anti-sigma factor RsiW
MTQKQSWWRRRRSTEDVATCREVARVLQSYLDGHVDDLTARRVARHLEMCRRCGMEARTYAEIKAALARRGPEVDLEAVRRLRAFGAELLENDPDDPRRPIG